jgi:hypothetical protein
MVAQRCGKLEQGCLRLVDENELSYAQPRQPPAQLGPDGSSRACNEDARAGDVVGELSVADPECRATEQRLEREIRALSDGKY